ncbi:MAG: hypothetical protein HQ483_12645 [Rhodospirillales bacterium]|nr:hypothetical protein [Rhodospirillales bacterium]
MTLLLVKICVSVLLVLGLSWIAEHVNPRIAGILSGMPLGAVLILFFVGAELGPEFAATSALYAIPSITATIGFALGYYFFSRTASRFSPLFSTLAGLVCYFLVAGGLTTITFDLLLGVSISLTALLVFAYSFHSRATDKIQTRPQMTFARLMFRSGMAAAFVVVITAIANFVGPRWSGLLIGFPMTFLPFLLIIHVTYSGAQVRTIIRNFPLGLIGLLCFLTTASQTIPLFGVNLAILSGLAAALTYLSLLGLFLNRRRPVPAE